MASEALAIRRFFVLQEGVIGSRYDADAEKAEPVNRGSGARCPSCDGVIGMKPWLPPYRANLVLHGEEFGDFIKTSGDDLLISERFAKAFREEELTGLEGFHPVEVVRVRRKGRSSKPSHVPPYLTVKACFGRGAVDLERSRFRGASPPTCEECRYTDFEAVHGYTLEPGTWQGEDVFRPRGFQGRVLVSERFERFVARHGFTNLRLTPTEEFVWDPLAPEPSTKEGSA